jgi:methionine synthase II (cobalamin-independent)
MQVFNAFYIEVRCILKPYCACTGIGSFPHLDAHSSIRLILDNCPEIPFWPQLPQVSYLEDMLIQYTEKMPGVRINEEKNEAYFLHPEEAAGEIENFYLNFSDCNLDWFKLSKSRASAFNVFLEEVKKIKKPILLKGQVCGPITLGGSLKVENNVPAIYDENYRDIIIKYLGMNAKWQEEKLKETLSDVPTLIFFDEPLLSTYGSVCMNLGRNETVEILNNCMSHISGLKGMHICGGCDWSMIMETGVDVVHFDAYSHLQSFLSYGREIQHFLSKGGIISWGIVPSGGKREEIEKESAESIVSKFEKCIDVLSESGSNKNLIRENSIIAPSCGLKTLTMDLAEKVMHLTKNASDSLKEKYNF